MDQHAEPPLRFPTPIACFGCSGMMSHPRWIRADRREYQPLCTACLGRLQRTFTPEAAIRQATGIVKFELAVLSGRCVRADGGEE